MFYESWMTMGDIPLNRRNIVSFFETWQILLEYIA